MSPELVEMSQLGAAGVLGAITLKMIEFVKEVLLSRDSNGRGSNGYRVNESKIDSLTRTCQAGFDRQERSQEKTHEILNKILTELKQQGIGRG